MATKNEAAMLPYPYTFKLPDGRTVFIEMPAEMVRRVPRSGEIAFDHAGVEFLDRVRALAMEISERPTAGQIRSLRQALDLTQAEFGARIGVNSLTVSRWDRGEMTPGSAAVRKMRQLRQKAVTRGTVIPTVGRSRGPRQR